MNEQRKIIILRFLLGEMKSSSATDGCTFWLPNKPSEHRLVWRCAVEILKSEPTPPYQPPANRMVWVMNYGEDTRENKTEGEIYSTVADCLWLMCLRGILRPGALSLGAHFQSDGQPYSLTSKGREWVKSYTEDEIKELLSAL